MTGFIILTQMCWLLLLPFSGIKKILLCLKETIVLKKHWKKPFQFLNSFKQKEFQTGKLFLMAVENNWFGTICYNIFQWKKVIKGFMTAFQEVKLNPDILIGRSFHNSHDLHQQMWKLILH